MKKITFSLGILSVLFLLVFAGCSQEVKSEFDHEKSKEIAIDFVRGSQQIAEIQGFDVTLRDESVIFCEGVPNCYEFPIYFSVLTDERMYNMVVQVNDGVPSYKEEPKAIG